MRDSSEFVQSSTGEQENISNSDLPPSVPHVIDSQYSLSVRSSTGEPDNSAADSMFEPSSTGKSPSTSDATGISYSPPGPSPSSESDSMPHSPMPSTSESASPNNQPGCIHGAIEIPNRKFIEPEQVFQFMLCEQPSGKTVPEV